MAFSYLMRDTVDVLKKDGSSFKGLRASVQGSRVFIAAGGMVIQVGDLIVRHMSTGADETFQVLDPGFYEGTGRIPPNYQMHVRRLDAPEANAAVQSITYNVTGSNARINQNSVDNSTNIVGADPRTIELLDALRAEIETLILAPDERLSALEVVAALQDQVESQKPSRAVVRALLAVLPTVAGVTAIAASILSTVK